MYGALDSGGGGGGTGLVGALSRVSCPAGSNESVCEIVDKRDVSFYNLTLFIDYACSRYVLILRMV